MNPAASAAEAQAGWYILGAALIVIGGLLAYALALELRVGGRRGVPATGALGLLAGLLALAAAYLAFLARLDPNAAVRSVPAPEWLVAAGSLALLAALGVALARMERCVRALETSAAPADTKPEAPAPRLERGPRRQSG